MRVPFYILRAWPRGTSEVRVTLLFPLLSTYYCILTYLAEVRVELLLSPSGEGLVLGGVGELGLGSGFRLGLGSGLGLGLGLRLGLGLGIGIGIGQPQLESDLQQRPHGEC